MYKLKNIPKARIEDIESIVHLLAKVKKEYSWTKEKKELVESAIELLRGLNAHFFSADRRTHGITQIGDHKILTKDHNRAGNLISFRGIRVLVVTVRSGERNNRGYAAIGIEE
jgi:hypothetical protein